MRNKFALLVLVAVLGSLVGCESLDRPLRTFDRALFTPTEFATNNAGIVPIAWKPNAATIATIEGVSSLVPGYGSLAGILATSALGLVAHLRSRRFKAAAVSVIDGVEQTLSKLPEEHRRAAIEIQKATQEDAGTRETVRALINA